MSLTFLFVVVSFVLMGHLVKASMNSHWPLVVIFYWIFNEITWMVLAYCLTKYIDIDMVIRFCFWQSLGIVMMLLPFVASMYYPNFRGTTLFYGLFQMGFLMKSGFFPFHSWLMDVADSLDSAPMLFMVLVGHKFMLIMFLSVYASYFYITEMALLMTCYISMFKFGTSHCPKQYTIHCSLQMCTSMCYVSMCDDRFFLMAFFCYAMQSAYMILFHKLGVKLVLKNGKESLDCYMGMMSLGALGPSFFFICILYFMSSGLSPVAMNLFMLSSVLSFLHHFLRVMRSLIIYVYLLDVNKSSEKVLFWYIAFWLLAYVLLGLYMYS